VRSGGRFSNVELISFFTMMLIEQGHIEEAERLISSHSDKDGKDVPTSSKLALLYSSLRAWLKVYSGETTDIDRLHLERFADHPCVEYSVISTLSYIVSMQKLQKPKLTYMMQQSFPRLEKAGLASFEFYRTWALVEMRARNFDGAIEKIKAALRFEGDRNWAFLNWGQAAYEKGDLKTAREKFQQRLAEGPVLSTVFSLLETLLMQNDEQSYLNEFERYRSMLHIVKERAIYEAYALIFACRLGQSAPQRTVEGDTAVNINGEVYLIGKFDSASCAFVH
jgi:hypothetical protein